MSMTRIRYAGISLLVIALSAAPARAAGTLSDALTAIAQDVKKFLDGRGEAAVTVGQFRGTGAFGVNASAGPNLVRALTRELNALGVDVRLKSNLTVLGDFEEAEDRESQLQVVLLRIELRERKTGKKTELEHRFVKNQAALAVLLGLTVEFPPEAGPKRRNREIKEQIDKPRTHITGSRVSAQTDSRFGVEILVAPPDPVRDGKRTEKDYKARTPEDREQSGLAFVKIARGEVYGVRLINDADFDVAVSLTIDGLNMFVFSADKDPGSGTRQRDPKTGLPLFNHIIVKAKTRPVIRGWFVNLKQSDEFKVTEYAKSAAKALASSANLGTITACFHAAWDPKGKPPPGEPRGDAQSQAADATGRGARFEQKYELLERKIGALRAAVSVRYTR